MGDERNFHTFILRQKGKLQILKAAEPQGDVDTKLHLNLIKSFSISERSKYDGLFDALSNGNYRVWGDLWFLKLLKVIRSSKEYYLDYIFVKKSIVSNFKDKNLNLLFGTQKTSNEINEAFPFNCSWHFGIIKCS